MLVHGIGSSWLYFERLTRVLARRWPVVAVDLPGFGRSPRPDRTLTIAEHSQALGEFLEDHGLGGGVLVGHSLGCQVVAGVLRDRPAAASRAVLIGPTVDDQARSAVRQGLRLARNMAREPRSLMPVQVSSYLACGPRTYVGTVRPMLRDHIEEALPQVRVPVQFVRGEHDPIAPRRWVAALSALTPQAALAEVPGAHHVVQWSHPEVVAELCSGGAGA